MQSTIFIALLVFIDQLTKLLVKFNLSIYQKVDILGSFLRFTYVENQGIAFGIDTSRFHIFVIFLTVLAIIALLYYKKKLSLEYEKTPLILIIGGAIGNAIDRILVLVPSFNYFGVIDFIDIGFGYYRWFIFNLADTFITIGVILYFILQYKFNKEYNATSRNI